MKYLLWAALIYIAWRWLAAKKSANEQPVAASVPSDDAAESPEKMVGCAHCGIHLPLSEAVPGATGLHYCSEEHRTRHPGT